MQAVEHEILHTVEDEVVPILDKVLPVVESHVGELLAFALKHAALTVETKLRTEHNPLRQVELKAMQEVFDILYETLAPNSDQKE